MALINKAVGSRLVATIRFGAGQALSMFPGVIVGEPTLITQPSGRVVRMADVVLLMENQQGEKYLASRLHNLNFAFDRTDRVPELDGTADQPKAWQTLVREQSAAQLAYQLANPGTPSAPQSVDLAEIDIAEA